MATKPKVDDLSRKDEEILRGFEDPYLEEPPQQFGSPGVRDDVSKKEDKASRIPAIRDLALEVLSKIRETKAKVDGRCRHLVVGIPEEGNKALAQAMFRVFGVYTTKITYAQYVKALELRQRLAAEDRQRLETTK